MDKDIWKLQLELLAQSLLEDEIQNPGQQFRSQSDSSHEDGSNEAMEPTWHNGTKHGKKGINMNEALIEMAACDEGVLSVLTHLKNGRSEDAVTDFAENFCFTDHGLGLEFTDRVRLHEFLQKERELYPGSSFQTKKIFVAEDHVIAEWLLEYTIKEPFHINALRDVPVTVDGISVIRTRKGKIIEWSDYYDGLTARRTALALCFTDWIEY